MILKVSSWQKILSLGQIGSLYDGKDFFITFIKLYIFSPLPSLPAVSPYTLVTVIFPIYSGDFFSSYVDTCIYIF